MPGVVANSRPVSGLHIGDMRNEYRGEPLTKERLAADPLQQFSLWFEEACRAGVHEPNAMTVSTVGADGRPWTRIVLLKKVDERGFVFFTNLESRKAREIAGNDHVCLLFPWLAVHRQVIVGGRAEKLSTAEVMAYFVTRPVESQMAAWASPQSTKISSRQILQMKWEEMKRKFADGKVPLPSFWGGYRVCAEQMEFWQGQPNRLHDRFLYARRPDGSWTMDRLAP
jgi:pyridoxamine 5'-phosphate oxidase